MGEHLGAILGALGPERLDPLAPLAGACSARPARGIWPYATSRTSSGGTRTPSRCATELARSRRTNSLRSSACSRSSASHWSSRADRCERAGPEDLSEHGRVLDQRLLVGAERVQPRGDDALHRLRQRSSPVNRRAASRQHADVLLGVERVAAARGRAAPTASRPAGPTARAAAATRCAICVSESGESDTVALFALPPPQPGRRPSSSGRAVQTTSSGTPVAQSARWSTKSSSPSSAQCRSSNTSTVGRCSPSASKNRRQAANASLRRSAAARDADEPEQRAQVPGDPVGVCGSLDQRGHALRGACLGGLAPSPSRRPLPGPSPSRRAPRRRRPRRRAGSGPAAR